MIILVLIVIVSFHNGIENFRDSKLKKVEAKKAAETATRMADLESQEEEIAAKEKKLFLDDIESNYQN